MPDSPPLIVDNSSGADSAFAKHLQTQLEAEGFAVTLREPRPGAHFDTSVHFVADGVAVRVAEDVDRATLARIAGVVRASERARPQRKRFRAVPIYRRETSRVIAWVDIFDEGI